MREDCTLEMQSVMILHLSGYGKPPRYYWQGLNPLGLGLIPELIDSRVFDKTTQCCGQRRRLFDYSRVQEQHHDDTDTAIQHCIARNCQLYPSSEVLCCPCPVSRKNMESASTRNHEGKLQRGTQ